MPDRFIRPSDLRHELGVSAMWLWRHEKAGDLPPRTRLGPRTTGWWRSEIDRWKAAKAPAQAAGGEAGRS